MATDSMTIDEFEALHTWLSEQARWGEADRLGALNHITPAEIVAADGRGPSRSYGLAGVADRRSGDGGQP